MSSWPSIYTDWALNPSVVAATTMALINPMESLRLHNMPKHTELTRGKLHLNLTLHKLTMQASLY